MDVLREAAHRKEGVSQVRLTGDPYVVHLVETACIVECLLETTLKEADERRALRCGNSLQYTQNQ